MRLRLKRSASVPPITAPAVSAQATDAITIATDTVECVCS